MRTLLSLVCAFISVDGKRIAKNVAEHEVNSASIERLEPFPWSTPVEKPVTAADAVSGSGSMQTARSFGTRNSAAFKREARGFSAYAGRAVVGMQADMGVMALQSESMTWDMAKCKVDTVIKKFPQQCMIEFEKGEHILGKEVQDIDDAHIFGTLKTSKKLFESGKCTEHGETVRELYDMIFDVEQHGQGPCSICKKCDESGTCRCKEGGALALLLPRKWREERKAPCSELLKFLVYYPLFIDLYDAFKTSWKHTYRTAGSDIDKIANWLLKYAAKLDEKANSGGMKLAELTKTMENNKQNKKGNEAKLKRAQELEKQKQALQDELHNSGSSTTDEKIKLQIMELDKEIDESLKEPGSEGLIKDFEDAIHQPAQIDNEGGCGAQVSKKWEAAKDTLDELILQPCQDTGPRKENGTISSRQCSALGTMKRGIQRTFRYKTKSACSESGGKCPPGTACNCGSVVDVTKIARVNMAIFLGGNILTYAIGGLGGLAAGVASGNPLAGWASGTMFAAAFPDTPIEIALMIVYTAGHAMSRIRCSCTTLACKTAKPSHTKNGDIAVNENLRDNKGSSFAVNCYVGKKDEADDYDKRLLPFPGIKCGFVAEGMVTSWARKAARKIKGKTKTTKGGSCSYSLAACDTPGFVKRNETDMTLPYGTDAQNCVKLPIVPAQLKEAAQQHNVGK